MRPAPPIKRFAPNLQIFLTGMPDSGAIATVTIQSRSLVPLYAGAAPGLLGLEQVNVAVPADLQGVTSNLDDLRHGDRQPAVLQPARVYRPEAMTRSSRLRAWLCLSAPVLLLWGCEWPT